MKDRIFIVLLMLLFLAGCVAGGIGTYHSSEENYWKGDAYVISFELSAPGGNAKSAFTEAYVIVDDRERFEMKILDATRESLRFRGTVPSTAIRDGTLSYQFEYRTSGEVRRSRVYQASPRTEPEQDVGDNPIYAPGKGR